MHLRYTGPKPTRRYSCDYYTVDAPETSCWFCRHLTDVFFDYTNGPYMFFCAKLHSDAEKDPDGLHIGMIGECPDFEEEAEE